MPPPLAGRLTAWLDEHEARWPRRDEIASWAESFGDDDAAAWSACTRAVELVALAGLRGVAPAVALAGVGRILRGVVARLPTKEPRLTQGIHAAETAADARTPQQRGRILDLAQALLAEAEKSEKARRRLEEDRKKREPTDKETKAELARLAFAAAARACGFAALASAELQRGSASLVECAYALDDASRAIGALEATTLAGVDAAALIADGAHAAALRADLEKATA